MNAKSVAALTLSALLSVNGALGQTLYKCPTPAGVVQYQQTPCEKGGEAVTVRPIPSGAGSGLSETAKDYMADRDAYWAEKARVQKEDARRQEAIAVERRKAAATEQQAAAQWETARAIRATGWPR